MTLFIFVFIALILAGIQTAVPFIVKRTVIFGVTVPETYLRHKELMSYKRKYALVVAFISFAALAGYLLWAFATTAAEEQTVLAGTLIQFSIILVSFSLYFYFHGKTLQLKRKNNWGNHSKEVKIADLSARSQDEMLPWYLFLLPIIMTIGVIGYTILQYDLLPDQIPTHWGVNGPDAFTGKTPMSAVSMPLILLVMQVMFLGIHVGTKTSGIKLTANGTNASRIRQLSLRKYTSWLTLLVSFLVTFMFTIFQLNTIHPDLFHPSAIVATPIIFLIAVLAGTVAFAVKVGQSDKLQINATEEALSDFNEDAHWIGGLFYFNKQDPSIFVEKRFGVGWTLNFGNPIGYLIVIVPIVLIILFSFL